MDPWNAWTIELWNEVLCLIVKLLNVVINYLFYSIEASHKKKHVVFMYVTRECNKRRTNEQTQSIAKTFKKKICSQLKYWICWRYNVLNLYTNVYKHAYIGCTNWLNIEKKKFRIDITHCSHLIRFAEQWLYSIGSFWANIKTN